MAMMNMNTPKIGVLLFSNNGLRLSGKDTPDGTYESRMLKLEGRVLDGLKQFANLIYTGIVYTRSDLDRAMEAFQAEKAEGVFALYLSWAPDANWIRFQRDMPAMPVLFASMIPENIPFENTFSANDSVAANTVRGLVGSLQAGGSIARIKRSMLETVLGTYDDIMEKARLFFAAANVRARLKEAVVAHISRHHEVMWSTYVDGFSLFQHVGPEVKVLAASAVRREMDSIPDSDVQAALKQLTDKYAVMDDVDMDKLAASVRSSIAMDRVAAAAGADYIVMNDLDGALHKDLGLRPGFLPCPNGHGIPATPEGDIGAGTAAYILRILSGKPAVVVEPGYINPVTGFVDIGHGGPNDYTNPDSKVKIAKDTRLLNADVEFPGAGFAWQVIGQGVKTMLHLSQSNGGFKMACTVVEAQDVDYFHASFCHGRVKPLTGSPAEVFGKLLRFGTTQHYAVAPGDYRKELAELASIMNFEYLEA